MKKLPYYLQSGVEEVWIIDPKKQEIAIHWEGDSKRWDKNDFDKSISSKVLSHLTFFPKWLWERDDFPSSTIIEKLVRK
jgi:Uma2 family endonuclease